MGEVWSTVFVAGEVLIGAEVFWVGSGTTETTFEKLDKNLEQSALKASTESPSFTSTSLPHSRNLWSQSWIQNHFDSICSILKHSPFSPSQLNRLFRRIFSSREWIKCKFNPLTAQCHYQCHMFQQLSLHKGLIKMKFNFDRKESFSLNRKRDDCENLRGKAWVRGFLHFTETKLNSNLNSSCSLHLWGWDVE
jgi:hypothetical protein